jgi:hypothetical protein
VNGSPATVLDGVAGFGSLSLFDVSDNGTLVYFPGAATLATANVLVWVDRRGVEESIAGVPPRPYSGLRLSSDSRQVALQISSGTLNADIWVYDLDRGTLERRTFSERAFNPVWAPGRLIYRDGNNPSSVLTWIPSDGSTSQPTALTALERGIVRFPTSVSPDVRASQTRNSILQRRETSTYVDYVCREGEHSWEIAIEEALGLPTLHTTRFAVTLPKLSDHVRCSQPGRTAPPRQLLEAANRVPELRTRRFNNPLLRRACTFAPNWPRFSMADPGFDNQLFSGMISPA